MSRRRDFRVTARPPVDGPRARSALGAVAFLVAVSACGSPSSRGDGGRGGTTGGASGGGGTGGVAGSSGSGGMGGVAGAGATGGSAAGGSGATDAGGDRTDGGSESTRPSNVTVAGAAWAYQQGELVGPAGLTFGGYPALQAVLRDYAFDRCAGGYERNVPATSKFIRIAVPAAVGHYDLPASAVTTGTGSITADASDTGTLDVTHVDRRVIEGTVDATMAISRASVRGSFVVYVCGHDGEDLIEGTVCPLPSSVGFGSSPANTYAVSPGGRVAITSALKQVTVYAPHEAAGTCTYAADPAYGPGGAVTFDNPHAWVGWDDGERLYATTAIDSDTPAGQSASLFRVTPGGAAESCRFAAVANARDTDTAPSASFVLPDGSAAYLYWQGYGESRVDLQDPAFGKGDGVCRFASGADKLPHYTLASSATGDRLLFFETTAGVRRAVERDSALAPLLTFGGTASGLGEEGMADVTLLSRCPSGYCVANDFQFKLFAEDGSVLQIVFQVPDAYVLPGDQPYLAARFLGPGKAGSAWLRGDYLSATNLMQDVTVHLVAKP